MFTDLFCRAPHPIANLRREHMAFVARVPGRYEFTGEVIHHAARDERTLGHAYAWCPRCKAVSVYRIEDGASSERLVA